MGNFHLNETYATDIQTDFRFQLVIQPDAVLGLTEKIVGYIQSSDLPHAPGEPIIWHLPGGMKQTGINRCSHRMPAVNQK